MSYSLPSDLRHAIEESTHGIPFSTLVRALEIMTERYHTQLVGSQSRHVLNPTQRLVYGVTRAPATFGAVSAAFRAVLEVAPTLAIRTMTDLGSGPGTAMWAAASLFPELEAVTCVERDGGFIDIARELAPLIPAPVPASVRWVSGDLETVTIPPADLVVAAYAFSELGSERVASVVARAWEATRVVLVIVEPGTPAGFASVLSYRSILLELGAHLVAPCPHANACPMAESDWCHFAARIDRSSLHRRLKHGEHGHEDEKYSYIAVTRSPVSRAPARILRHPRKPPRVVELSLCATDGLRRAHVGKSNRDTWREARDAQWGDAWRH